MFYLWLSTAFVLNVLVGVPGQGESATISGIVLDEKSGEALQGALVSLTFGAASKPGATVVAGSNGGFVLGGIPAGRVTVRARFSGYVESDWRIGQAPRVFVIESGQKLAGIRLLLRRGGAIGGTVASAGRNELPGATVRLLRCEGLAVCDARHARQIQSVLADDRGAYRFFGLPDGNYFVSAYVQVGSGPEQVALSSDEDIRLATKVASEGRSTLPSSSARAARFATSIPSFYPGSADPDAAEVVRIQDGAEHLGVNVTTRVGTSARISGRVVGISPMPKGLRVWMSPSQPTLMTVYADLPVSADGTFTTPPLPPGDYRISAQIGTDWWAEESFQLSQYDIEQVSLRLQPSQSIAGAVVVDSLESDGIDLSGLSIGLNRVDVAVRVSSIDMHTGITDINGRYVIKGLAPGRYVLTISWPSANNRFNGLSVKSALQDGYDILDSFCEVKLTVDTPKTTITLTKTPSVLAGAVRYRSGKPASEYSVIAFPMDPAQWVSGSRRILVVPVLSDGSFVVKPLPAGKYFVGLLGLSNLGDIDRGVLAEVAAGAHVLVIGDGESKSVVFEVGERTR